MLTRLGFWLLFVFATLVGVGVLVPELGVLVVLALPGLLWLAWEWLWHAVRCRRVVAVASVERTVGGKPAGRATFWAGHTVTVGVRLRCRGRLRYPLVTAADRVPPLAVVVAEDATEQDAREMREKGGRARDDAEPEDDVPQPASAWRRSRTTDSWAADRPLTVAYRLKCDAPGRLAFPGVALTLGDAHGLFRSRLFLRGADSVMVLPALVRSDSPRPLRKPFNVQLAHGHHRYLRAGSGTELLDLRDYIPGDPPKAIAWKVSARRDRLVTREYESEVPIRARLFVEASDAVRTGGGGRSAIAHSVTVAAGLARRLIDGRDPVGLVLFDQHGAEVLPPAPGQRHLAKILSALATAAGTPRAPGPMPAGPLIEPCWRLVGELYPSFLQTRLNSPGPWWRRLWHFSPRNVAVVLVLFALVGTMIGFALKSESMELAAAAAAVAGLYIGLSVVAWLFGRPRSHRWDRSGRDPGLLLKRKQVAAVLAARQSLGAGAIAVYGRDDRAFALAAQVFLQEHHVPYARPLHDRHGRYLFRCDAKVAVLAGQLARAVGRARDNELFVLMVDLIERLDQAEPLFKAIRMARSRHHDVVVVCPWPASVPKPGSDDWPQPDDRPEPLPPGKDNRELLHLDRQQYARGYERLAARLGKLRVPVICAEPGDAVHRLIDRVERLRNAATAVR